MIFTFQQIRCLMLMAHEDNSHPVASFVNKAGTLLRSLTDLQGRSQNLHHFFSALGSNWGIWVFPVIKITLICQVCMYCGLT